MKIFCFLASGATLARFFICVFFVSLTVGALWLLGGWGLLLLSGLAAAVVR